MIDKKILQINFLLRGIEIMKRNKTISKKKYNKQRRQIFRLLDKAE